MKVSPINISNILFVCTGNTCRSPMAEGQLRILLPKSPLAELHVGSAGIVASPGDPASFNAVRAAQENSISLVGHRARLLTRELVKEADLILVMEPNHLKQLLSRYPEASDKVTLLRQFARYGSQDRGISDPYGLSIEAYRFCFEDIKECVQSLYGWLLAGVDPE